MDFPWSLVRALNWINLSTPCGLLLARAKGCPVSRGPHGLLLAEGYTGALPRARAFTVGGVVFLRGPRPQASEALLGHEARHARQYAACLGLPFLPLYFGAAAWSLLRTGDPASRNVFERSAGLNAGGYREHQVRELPAVAFVRARRRKRN
ncbi:DUF4157 domain-containing protein [Arthrobacter sp. Br18]|uniref:eCIS core domain-containing protein n=1 Tax=Arthrobacter sp. Br18 TaxID=1312954 RepID=UPI00047CF18E|nr:DUF4157 domain-containing protein [Arthrobacter sp. Br18]